MNPTTQAGKFDPDGEYVRRWLPELDGDDYPEPIVDHARERTGRCAATGRSVDGPCARIWPAVSPTVRSSRGEHRGGTRHRRRCRGRAVRALGWSKENFG